MAETGAQRPRDKAAIVTGGASGIGRAICERFAAEGCRVVIADIDAAGGDGVAQEIRSQGLEAHFVKTDVADENSVRRLVAEALDRYGKVDILVNNAFYRKAQGENALDLSNEVWERSMDVMLKGAWWMVKYCLPSMLEQERGVIINMASRLALQASPNSFAYCIAKAGLVQMARSLAVDFGRRGIRAVSICPGMVETPTTEALLSDPKVRESTLAKRFVGRIATPGDIAEAALFLASDAAAQIQGEALVIDGGASVI